MIKVSMHHVSQYNIISNTQLMIASRKDTHTQSEVNKISFPTFFQHNLPLLVFVSIQLTWTVIHVDIIGVLLHVLKADHFEL